MSFYFACIPLFDVILGLYLWYRPYQEFIQIDVDNSYSCTSRIVGRLYGLYI